MCNVSLAELECGWKGRRIVMKKLDLNTILWKEKVGVIDIPQVNKAGRESLMACDSINSLVV
jgi:hypothetical protein